MTSLDEVLQCLVNPRRRRVLYYLREEEVASIDDLASEIVAWESDASPGETSEEHRQRAKTVLYHTHLPVLADSLLIEYDERTETVRYSEPPAMLEDVLDNIAELDDVCEG